MTCSAMYSSNAADRTYSHAIDLLNSLQSNQTTIAQLSTDPPRNQNESSIPEMIQFVNRCGYQVDELNSLNLIHIAGTKGKGSTCAFIESILRNVHNRSTGLYTSPHLLEVRERIRINGKPLEYACFAKYFFHVWDRFCVTEADAVSKGQQAKPHYFRFLTCLAFHIFKQEKVNAAILEVGIGGRYDCTNIVTNPRVTGITSLGIDHTAILGATLGEIAAHKAGIMKPGVPCITVPQPADGMRVLTAFARQVNTRILLAHPISYESVPDHMKLNIALAGSVVEVFLSPNSPGQKHITNATCRSILHREYGIVDHTADDSAHDELEMLDCAMDTGRIAAAVAKTKSYGRNHYLQSPVKYPGCDFFIDGAHTFESITKCMRWYSIATRADQSRCHLVFNLTHNRDPYSLLRPLVDFGWASVTFTTNAPFSSGVPGSGDTFSVMPSTDNQSEMRRAWMELSRPGAHVHVTPSVDCALSRIADSPALPPNPKVRTKPATKHYEQATQAMVLKDRQRLASNQQQKKNVPKKNTLILNSNKRINPNEIKFPDGLKTDEKERLLNEIKKKWQVDFGQRIRVEEANRSLKDQLNKVKSRLSKLEDQIHHHPMDAPADLVEGDSQAVDSGGDKHPSNKKNANAMVNEQNVLRQTNIIVVLTKRNKELINERKKMEHLVHLKTLVAEQEIQKASKLQHVLDSEKSKHARDKLKLQTLINDLQTQKHHLDELLKENQRKYEALDRVNLSLEHQVLGLKDKLDSVMIDYSDVLVHHSTAKITDPDNQGQSVHVKNLGSADEVNTNQDELIKQARLAIEYDTWVNNKSTHSSPVQPTESPDSKVTDSPAKPIIVTNEQEQIQRLQKEAELKEVEREIQAEHELIDEQKLMLDSPPQPPPTKKPKAMNRLRNGWRGTTN